ncbi:MAG TPA: acetyl-CoA carboxylase biotin carboxylase subunit, partial [Gemmatimonadales bacterium]|nr:acetyl-CoA carboxylase biotin carboxylase subunit [Gemmatimonadales bacterium]
FLPSTGRVRRLELPQGPGVRWDGGIAEGFEVGLHYDPLLGKLVVHAEDRPAAIRRMRRALGELVVVGVATNQAFHQRLLADPEFQRGEVDIQFLDRREDLLTGPADPAQSARIAVAAALAEEDRRQHRKPAVSVAEENGGEWSRVGRLEGLR